MSVFQQARDLFTRIRVAFEQGATRTVTNELVVSLDN